ncbi:MAG: RNase H1/viroplasmin domain-containing protein [Pseudomonadales bacterium]|nr:RNase H1/viroplasmin domain-containing protein [Pseudomonadales bacterium]
MPKIKSKQKKCYVVFVGHKTGVFKTWAEVIPLVSGYPHSQHKSYTTFKKATAAFSAFTAEDDKFETSSSAIKAKFSNSPYNIKNASCAILFLQNLLNNQPEGEWTHLFGQEEVRFVYDMVNRANCFSQFSPTEKQSRWMIEIIGKYKLIPKVPKPSN